MQGIAILFVLVSQYALGDGRILDRSLKVGERVNPVQDPLARARTQSPLDNRIGLQRFDNRFINDGLRFAPEFQRGNDIYKRSLLFDYGASTGWRISDPTSRYPTTDNSWNLSRGYVRPAAATSSSSRINTAVPSTRIDNRVDQRRVDYRPIETSRTISRPILAVPAPLPDPLPIVEVAMSEEQILKVFQMELKDRLERCRIEKKVFGDIQGRTLTQETLVRYGHSNQQVETLIGENPELRLKRQLEEIPLRSFLKDFPEALKNLPFEEESRKKLDESFQDFLKNLKAEIKG